MVSLSTNQISHMHDMKSLVLVNQRIDDTFKLYDRNIKKLIHKSTNTEFMLRIIMKNTELYWPNILLDHEVLTKLNKNSYK